ncbi:MAG: hypothetical protein K6A35_07125 [bacterium]|nr:hypothetical protein [bacterium]
MLFLGKAFVSLDFNIPHYVTIAALLFLIYLSTIGVKGEHRCGYAVGQRLGEALFLAIVGFLLPGITMTALPGMLIFFPKGMGLVHFGIVWAVIGVVVTTITWFFKHDFSDHDSKLYVGQKTNEVRSLNITIQQQPGANNEVTFRTDMANSDGIESVTIGSAADNKDSDPKKK